MTYALDLTEGQPEGHALRGCLVGMAVGAELGLGPESLSDLFYALLLKDLGCSSNSAKIHYIFGADDFRVKRAFKTTNLDRLSEGAPFVLAHAGSAAPLYRRLRHVIDVSLGRHGGHTALTEVRCERGADIARQMGFSEATAAAIRALVAAPVVRRFGPGSPRIGMSKVAGLGMAAAPTQSRMPPVPPKKEALPSHRLSRAVDREASRLGDAGIRSVAPDGPVQRSVGCREGTASSAEWVW